MTSDIQRIDRDHVTPGTRRLYAEASLVALGGNILLLAVKGAAALISGSSAIYADAANSASDVAYSLLMGIGLWLSLRPPDAGHPHGHRRIEPLVNLFIGAMMAYAGVEAARSGLESLRAGTVPEFTFWALAALIFTGVVKSIMFMAASRLGRRANSPALLATARDNLSDIVSSALALVGYLGARLVIPAVDPIAAFLVSLWIFRSAWGVLSDGVRGLTGGAPSPELSESIAAAALSVPGVLGAHRVIVEHIGPQVYVDIHVYMPHDTPLSKAHQVSHGVRAAIQGIEEVDHAYVHIEPVDESKVPPGVSPACRCLVCEEQGS